MSDGGGKITLHIRCETFWQSLANDLVAYGLLVGLIAINELTLQSKLMSFLLAGLGLFALIAWVMGTAKNEVVSGDTTEEVIAKLRQALKQRGAP